MLAPTESARRWLGIAVATAMLASLIPLTGVAAANATHFQVSAPTSVVSGTAFNVTVTALDGANATDTGYTGTVHFTTTNATSTLPADYTFVVGDNGVHTFSATLSNWGSDTITVTDTGNGAVTGTSGTINVHASKLVFSVQPGGATGGQPLGPQPTVEVQDATGAVVTTAAFGGSLAVTLAIQNNPGAGAISGCSANPVTATNGVAAFGSCSINKAGTGYTLRASASGVTNAVSDPFDITLGGATKLAFTSYPTNPSTTSLATITVAIQDAGGNTVTSSSATVALSSNPADSLACTSAGGLSHATVNGVWSFTGCTITVANGYTLHADDGGALTDVTGSAFNVTSGAATKLAFCWGAVTSSCSTAAPTTASAGTAWTTQPTIVVQDASSRTVTTDSSTTVNLTIASGTPTAGGPGTLSCTSGTSMHVSAGVASFSGCSIDKLGTAYKLTATSSPAFTSATSNAFNVAAGAATKLVFTSQPTTASAGQAFPVQPVVAITDAGGNTSTTSVATITLSLGTNPASGTLTCTSGNTRSTVNGVATFAGCAINNAGNGYTLVATATNVSPAATLTNATSNAFNVTAQAAQITLTTTATVITWGSGVTLTAHFAVNGNAKQFTLQRSSPDHVSWATIATLTTDSSGNASLFYRPATNNWYRAVFAGTGDLTAANSNEVRVVVRQIAILRPTNAGLVKNVALNSSRSFVTTVRPARPELPAAKVTFVFYKLVSSHHWVLVTTREVYIDSSGVARYAFRFNSPGEWYVRSIARPTVANANSVWSRVERYSVR